MSKLHMSIIAVQTYKEARPKWRNIGYIQFQGSKYKGNEDALWIYLSTTFL